MHSYYPNNPEWNDAAVLLDLMSAEQIQKIIALVDARGPAVITDLKARQRSSQCSLSPLVVLDTRWVPSEDLEDVALGMATILIGKIRQPVFGVNEYEAALKNGFTLSSDMAVALAKKVETEDILGGTYKDANGAELPWYKTWAGNVQRYIRKSINAVPGASILGWEIDANQEYDLDLLYEWKLFGGVVRELNSRTKLMQGQAALNATTSAFSLTGDVESGDVESLTGDALRSAAVRRLPGLVFGKATGLANMANFNRDRASEFIRNHASNPQSRIGRILARAMNQGPSLAMLKMLVPGSDDLLAAARHGLNSNSTETGDAYSTISSTYGNNPAAAWQMGDVESFLREVGAIADSDVSTGDPALDSAIESAVMEEISGDIEGMSPEMGGLFTRARINMAKRRAARRKRRSSRKYARQQRRDIRNEALIRAKNAASSAGIADDGDWSNYEGGASQYDDSSADEGSDDGMMYNDGEV